MTCNALVLGASYGSLFGTKLAMAGHRAHLVCTEATAALINSAGTVVRFPLRGARSTVDIASQALPGTVTASVPDAVDPSDYDLVVLAMQEAQYRVPDVRALMRRIAAAGRPCLAIMNMPPLPYLKRIPGLDTAPLESCYADARVWDGFDPQCITLASPDPQAFRPQDEPKNVLQVGLPTNFKVAPFEAGGFTELLRQLGSDIEAARLNTAEGPIEVPVKLKVHDSIFVPLAKWPMLMTGNYRCILPDQMISIRDAVHGNVAMSRQIYDWVSELCLHLGADPDDLVPFEKYAKAAEDLRKPSAAARALFGGASHIERVDHLIRRLADQFGRHFEPLHEIAALVDERLRSNRAAVEAA